jgi:phenylacetate-CoA ligase
VSNIKEYFYDAPYLIRNLGVNYFGFKLYKKRFSSTFQSFYKQLLNNLELSKEVILEYQFEKLKATLTYAYLNTEYYHSVFNEYGFDPKSMVDFSDLNKIPTITKNEIKRNFDKIKSTSYTGKSVIHSTSGTTGPKTRFLIPEKLLYPLNAAFLYRHYSLLGIKPGDRRVTLGGRKFTNRKPFWSINYFENQLLLSSHHLNMVTASSYIERILKFRPVFIQGHPSALKLLSEYIISSNSSFDIDIKGIFTTGEVLSNPDRLIISRAFNTTVLQQYGSGESCISAFELSHNSGYFLDFERGFAEVIGDGPRREVYATSFLNLAMPFIRYRVGDLVEIGEEGATSSNLPYFCNHIIGRNDDVFYLEKGKKVLPVSIRMAIKPLLKPGTEYQLLQKSYNFYSLRIVDFDRIINVKDIRDALKSLLGDSIQVKVTYVESLVSEGGKVRNIIRDMNL